jgi:hypothetical protein
MKAWRSSSSLPCMAASTDRRCTLMLAVHTAAQPRGSAPTRGMFIPLPST